MRPEAKPEIRHWAMDVSVGRALEAPGEFGMVGVSVPEGVKTPGRVLVRASGDGAHWGNWTALEFEAEVGPDLGSAEQGAHTSMPVWTGRKRFVDVRFPDG